jgi:hypothetical protein
MHKDLFNPNRLTEFLMKQDFNIGYFNMLNLECFDKLDEIPVFIHLKI